MFSERWKRVPASYIKHEAGYQLSIIHLLFSLHLLSTSSFLIALFVYPQSLKTNMASDAERYRVLLSSHLNVWKGIGPTPPVLTMISRDATGNLEGRYPMEKAKHLVSASNLCRGMLKEHKVREGFITFAVRFGSSQPNAWYKQVRPPKTTAEVVDSFINTMLTDFSTEFVDYALKTPDNKGFHNRRRWDEVFEPALQPISLNAKVREIHHVSGARVVQAS